MSLDNRIDPNNPQGEYEFATSNYEYPALINQFFLLETPATVVSATERFEAISAIIMGSKQRRYGPLPPPEVQVAVREVIRDRETITFFLPWGSRKQTLTEGNSSLDVMEFMALKQLQCLQTDLKRLGVTAHFIFRLEDLTDRWLFSSTKGIWEYRESFTQLVLEMLGPKSVVAGESDYVNWEDFSQNAYQAQRLFYAYFNGGEHSLLALQESGWHGEVSEETREHYLRQYRQMWPDKDEVALLKDLARYLGAAAARKWLKATAIPEYPHIFLTFSHPVPGNPSSPNRLYMRTIPQRYTNNHRSPWIGQGYLQIREDGSVIPKSLAVGDLDTQLALTPNKVTIGNVTIDAPYLVV